MIVANHTAGIEVSYVDKVCMETFPFSVTEPQKILPPLNDHSYAASEATRRPGTTTKKEPKGLGLGDYDSE